MKGLLRLEEISRKDAALVGGKAVSLRRLQENGIRVPQTFCVPGTVYETYLAQTGIKKKILFRLNRKPLEQMRWEEIWDISLHIRNLFVTVPFPPEMEVSLGRDILDSCGDLPHAVIRVLLQMAKRPMKYAGRKTQDSDSDRVRQYLSCFPESRQEFAKEVLQMGRKSFRLRDDDNIHLGRIETRLFEAVNEGRLRLSDSQTGESDRKVLSFLPSIASSSKAQESRHSVEKEPDVSDLWISARQIAGHPAGPGIAKGTARVIIHPSDLLDFRDGEVLVCASVDPNMTFVVPLARAVVEERGGMLIHGAIIAREYGLPCITGAPDVTQLIRTGDTVTVDGYLGILTCDTGPFNE